jgi:hypothetical protein
LIAGSIDVMFVQRLHRQQFAAELAVAAGASIAPLLALARGRPCSPVKIRAGRCDTCKRFEWGKSRQIYSSSCLRKASVLSRLPSLLGHADKVIE